LVRHPHLLQGALAIGLMVFMLSDMAQRWDTLFPDAILQIT